MAVWPDEATRRLLGRLELDIGKGRGLRFVGSARWHVTLRFLGRVDEPDPISEALTACCAAFPGPLECRLGPATDWFTAVRVLQVPAAGIDSLAAVVRRATLPWAPESPDEPPFNGHLTVARSKGRRHAAAARDAVAGQPFEASFSVRHVDLVASDPAPEGHRYTTLARAHLGPTGS